MASDATLRAHADLTGFESHVPLYEGNSLGERDLRTRIFAVAFGYREDPSAGFGNPALAHWLR